MYRKNPEKKIKKAITAPIEAMMRRIGPMSIQLSAKGAAEYIPDPASYKVVAEVNYRRDAAYQGDPERVIKAGLYKAGLVIPAATLEDQPHLASVVGAAVASSLLSFMFNPPEMPSSPLVLVPHSETQKALIYDHKKILAPFEVDLYELHQED